MSSINVVVNGVSGRMGQEVLRAMCREPDMVPVGGADPKVESDSMGLPDGSGSIPISSSLLYVLGGAQVVVDFTNAEGALDAIRTAAARGGQRRRRLDRHPGRRVRGGRGPGTEPRGRRIHRTQLRLRRRADGPPRPRGGPLLRLRRPDRAAPRDEDRRPVGHRYRHSQRPPPRARETTSRRPKPRRRSSRAHAGGPPRAS